MSQIVAIGSNPTLLWGMTTGERLRRIVEKSGMPTTAQRTDEALLLVNANHVFDPAWIAFLRERSGEVVTLGGIPVIAHCRTPEEARLVRAAMEADQPLGPGVELIETPYEAGGLHLNAQLRKREQPFMMRLDQSSVRAAERASYFGAYKGVTDILTKYLWPEWALVLTRVAARIGATPNMVTAVGAILCVLATILFWNGDYWWGIAAGLAFMVLDTVDGKLARCTITSSKWGNVFDHGIDLVHPPFWWWAWGVGLGSWGLAYSSERFFLIMLAIVGGYVVQRLIEGAFIRMFGMHIHVWQRIDSQFRLITARRNPNMVILFGSLLFGRPDVGLELVAWWTVLSCLFHAVRLVQAMLLKRRGGEIRSWLG